MNSSPAGVSHADQQQQIENMVAVSGSMGGLAIAHGNAVAGAIPVAASGPSAPHPQMLAPSSGNMPAPVVPNVGPGGAIPAAAVANQAVTPVMQPMQVPEQSSVLHPLVGNNGFVGGGMPPLYNNIVRNMNVNASGAAFSASGGDRPEGYDPSKLATPWTLGSTDGRLAMQLVVIQQQQFGGSVSSAGSHNSQTQSPQHAHTPVSGRTVSSSGSLGGVAINASGEASIGTNTTTSASSNNTGNSPGQTGKAPIDRKPSDDNSKNDIKKGRGKDPNECLAALQAQKSLYEDLLFEQPSSSVEAVLAASCEVMGFDIAEMWLRTGPKTHQLTNSHLRPTALEDSVRDDIVDVYYGERSSERTHRLSPALCKRAKEANDVVWVTAHTSHGAEALRCSISNVRTAVAIPICHEASNTNMTIIFFSIRR